MLAFNGNAYHDDLVICALSAVWVGLTYFFHLALAFLSFLSGFNPSRGQVAFAHLESCENADVRNCLSLGAWCCICHSVEIK